ncbi:protein HEG isoform X1 [Carassius gibelio]|uniref:protein HEG isoform X1 n=1 Tax=Carassius gibelio TaxID=101364 RepID=UPI0022792782|nr:protein HEG isoform X1 [Carassius gibelio]
METCVERRACRVVLTVFLLVLNTVIAETFSPYADTDNPLSKVTETFFTRTGLKQTSSWPGREATATAVDLSTGLDEMTDIPVSVSTTGAREGHLEKLLGISANTAGWRMTSEDATEDLQTDKAITPSAASHSITNHHPVTEARKVQELTHNATDQWEAPSVASHSITSHHPVTEARTVREFTHNATDQWEAPSVASHSITSHHPVTEARTVREFTHNATAQWEAPSVASQIITSHHPVTEARTVREFTHNATAQWEAPSVASHSITSHHPVTEARTVREFTHNATAQWEVPSAASHSITSHHPVTEARTVQEFTHNATVQWEVPSAASHSITSHHPVTEARTVREFTHNATDQWEAPSAASQSITSHHPVTEARTVQEFTHNATGQWEAPSVASQSITSHHPVTEARTVREVPVTDLKEIDTTDSVSHTDSTYISTTNRVREHTVLSVTSNSTSAYTEDSNSSDAVFQTSSWEVRTSGATQGKKETVEDVSTLHEQTEPTFEDHNATNATQGHSLETEQSTFSHGTESQTGQSSVTGQTFQQVSDNDNPNSTPPLTTINRDQGEMDTTSMSGGTSYTETSHSVSSIPPFTSGGHNATSTSQQSRHSTMTNSLDPDASTEFSTGSVSSTGREELEGSPTHTMEKTTIQGLTTAPPVPEDVATTTDDSFTKFHAGKPPFVPKTDDPTNTEVVPTSAMPTTHRPHVTEEATDEASTVYSSTNSFTTMIPPVTTHQLQTSTTPQVQTEHTTIATTDIFPVLRTTPTTAQRPLTSTTGGPQAPSTSDSADVTTLHLETSTATPGNTTAHGRRATTPYSKSTPTKTTVLETTRNHTDRSTTEMGMTTTHMPFKSTASPDHVCGLCANGGHCVRSAKGSSHCQCLPAWTGPFCTEHVDECVNSPCPKDSVCVNTGGSFSCQCALGFDLEDGRSCTQVKTFLGTFTVNTSMHLRSSGSHELHREILQLLNASLSVFNGYRRSTLNKKDGGDVQISAVSMFSLSTNVTSTDVFNSIQMSLSNCSRTYSHCTIKLQHHLSYQAESLCSAQKTKCDFQYSECKESSGTPYCQCKPGYFKKNPEDMTCRVLDCGDGLMLVNGSCVECIFGFGGFNCSNFYKLIAVVVFPAGGALLLIVIIALIVTCCKKDKNDINKIIFKSGDLQMSPYSEFPKSNRVSMEWGRETIEMQENGSTKNLLQMTDIYYSPALRNADLERNGLYPFSGLPGSRHSCIYPAQWNPSFLSDDSRRRDYF